MKIFVKNTSAGLVPMYDQDLDSKKKLKLNEVYRVDVVKARNVDFHRLYFSLLNIGWEYLREEQQLFFHNSKEGFRKTVQIAAGFYTKIYSISRNEWVEESVSIAFDKMDEIEFKELYAKVKDVVLTMIEGNVSEEEFIMNLSRY